MKQSIRALGWVVTISTLLVFAYLASAIYSIVQMAMMNQGFMMGGLEMGLRDGSFVMSMPIAINNTGFYDINEFEITTTLEDEAGRLIATNTTRLTEIKRGDTRTSRHMLVMDLAEVFSRNRHLIFNDTEIRLLISVGFRYAYALGFGVSIANISMPWGAPMHGLTLKELIIRGSNETHLLMELTMDFENHFFIDVAGPLRLVVYNEKGDQIGEGVGFLYVPSGGRPEEPIPVIVALTRPEAFTGKGYAYLYLVLPIDEQQIELGRIEYE
jgi:hypothetical protein